MAKLQPEQQGGLLILGGGVSGLAAARLALHHGIPVWLWEEGYPSEQLPQDLRQHPLFFGDQPPPHLAALTFMPSPGISEDHHLYQKAQKHCGGFLSEVDWGLRYLPKIPVVAVTGTNAKSTVVSAITYGLRQLGVQAQALGNIGRAVSAEALQPHNVAAYVLELSSYQLTQSHNVRPLISVITTLERDHLQRHHTMESYVRCKWKVVSWAEKLAPPPPPAPYPLICTEDVLKQAQHYGLSYPHHLALTPKQAGLQEQGPDAMKALAALTLQALASKLPQQTKKHLPNTTKQRSAGSFMELLADFPSLPYRQQVSGSITFQERRCVFINDAKSTNLAATRYALEHCEHAGPYVVIIGGRLKQGEDSSLLATVTNPVLMWVCVGEARQTLTRELRALGEQVMMCEHLKDLWCHAAFTRPIQAGKVGCVLFSPGCESWDQYENFAERGADFNERFQEFYHKSHHAALKAF